MLQFAGIINSASQPCETRPLRALPTNAKTSHSYKADSRRVVQNIRHVKGRAAVVCMSRTTDLQLKFKHQNRQSAGIRQNHRIIITRPFALRLDQPSPRVASSALATPAQPQQQ